MSNGVVIQMYHNNPPVPEASETGDRGSVWMRVVWDHNCESAAEYAAGQKNKEDDESGVGRAYRIMVTDWLYREMNSYQLPMGKETGASVFHLTGQEPTLRNLARTWSNELLAEAESEHGIGGDDSYFDYFPDYVEGLHQLCSQVDGAKEIYNHAHQQLTKAGAPYDPEYENAEPDSLPLPFDI
jgi:hypothetical protein